MMDKDVFNHNIDRNKMEHAVEINTINSRFKTTEKKNYNLRITGLRQFIMVVVLVVDVEAS